MAQISINDGQLFLDGNLIDFGYLVEKAEIHDAVLIVKLSTRKMDREQMRRNIWGLDPANGKVLWQIQNRSLLPGQDPKEFAPDPFSRFYVSEGHLKVNTDYGHIYSLNAKNGTVEYLYYAG